MYAAPEELTEIGAFDEPGRDPRGRYVTVAYHLLVISGTPIEPALIHAIGHVKAAAAKASRRRREERARGAP